MNHRIVRCFLSASMSMGFDGLTLIAKKEGIDLRALDETEHVVFVNRNKDKFKIASANDCVTYVRLGKGRVVDLRIIAEIPKVFGAAKKFDYEAALEKFLKSKLGNGNVSTKA